MTPQKEAREPRKRTAIQQEIIDMIRFYEKRGSDWTVPAEFTLVRHSGNLERIIRPWDRVLDPRIGRPRRAVTPQPLAERGKH